MTHCLLHSTNEKSPKRIDKKAIEAMWMQRETCKKIYSPIRRHINLDERDGRNWTGSVDLSFSGCGSREGPWTGRRFLGQRCGAGCRGALELFARTALWVFNTVGEKPWCYVNEDDSRFGNDSEMISRFRFRQRELNGRRWCRPCSGNRVLAAIVVDIPLYCNEVVRDSRLKRTRRDVRRFGTCSARCAFPLPRSREVHYA
ncbi:hypothetical protein EVAR_36480_1 [Eumeta japonica]|uniref:Uncharacterized protein n=1 Tax=Eumeta variegata TaxID=151549 RepID=A0A4C1WW22_EUMVA|nr:hypothetical protein EVAR_36480_1 [Eumeta japonica]